MRLIFVGLLSTLLGCAFLVVSAFAQAPYTDDLRVRGPGPRNPNELAQTWIARQPVKRPAYRRREAQ